jgi:DNA-binding NtrC family response regulator
MLKTHLAKKYNLEIITFNNGEDCVKNLHLNPTYIVLDYYLNVVRKDAVNGVEILKQIKMILPEVYVIMLSSQDKIQVAVDCMKFGAYDYVVKNESSFLRVENILENIHSFIGLKKKANAYRTSTIFLSAVIGLIIIFAFVYKYLHIHAG